MKKMPVIFTFLSLFLQILLMIFIKTMKKM